MKKLIALTLAGAMIFSMPVMAKEGVGAPGAPVAVYLEADSDIGVPAEQLCTAPPTWFND